jgi:hypothetical protein
MRNILFLSLFVIFVTSCSKPDCGEELKALYTKKANALSYAQTMPQIQAIESQFDREEQKILSNCK